MKTKIFALIAALTLIAPSLALAAAPAGGEIRTFRVSAYYSPKPGQTKYLRGNYEAEIRLNGRGTNGADGTEVYPGMLAAPRTYAFGTDIYLPGLGIGTVHDRGGAIVPAGQRGQSHDRIDVWMGTGDEGLARALQWGMRTVEGRVYWDGSAQGNLDYTGVPQANISGLSNNPVYQPAGVTLGTVAKGRTNEAIKTLQKDLQSFGHFDAEVSGFFGDQTEEAIIAFQIAEGIIQSRSENGAGTFGPKTRARFQQLSTEQTVAAKQESSHYTKLLPAGLSRGSKGDEVLELQKLLSRLGYLSEQVNGVYGPQTESAIVAFQIDKGVIQNESSPGNGVFGPQTQKTVFDILKNRDTALEGKAKVATESMSYVRIAAPIETPEPEFTPLVAITETSAVSTQFNPGSSTINAVAGRVSGDEVLSVTATFR